MIRTRAIQSHSHLLYPNGEAIVSINPQVFNSPNLLHGDILLSKDSNIGECAIIHGNDWGNYTFSSGIVRLKPVIDRYYLFAFLKHPFFVKQLEAKTPKASTIRHAKTFWLDCEIPFPQQEDEDAIVYYVSALMQAIIDKEAKIEENSEQIDKLIEDELVTNQKRIEAQFHNPTYQEIKNLLRFDAVIYSQEYKSKIALIQNYSNGFISPSEYGFDITTGASLEIKLLKVRIDSDIYVENYYALVIPKNISVYGTINQIVYMGTPQRLPLLKKGDVIFGEAGFQKGRSVVLLDDIEKCTTNAHGIYARRLDGDINKSIFFRCIFNWYRNKRLIDIMAVGGSGGHFSPEYFPYIRIPLFPEGIQDKIVKLYHNIPNVPLSDAPFYEFVQWHRDRNQSLGIWELDKEIKTLQQELLSIQEKIFRGEKVVLETEF